MRRHRLAAVLAGVVVGGMLTACGAPAAPAPRTTDAGEGGIADAVAAAALPRTVTVTDPTRSRNGFGHRLGVTLLTDSAEAFSAPELDAVVEAIWRTLPWEPNAITVVAGVDGPAGTDPVDLRTAAARLDPMGFTTAGAGGVSLFDMHARYGAWTAPR